MTIEQLFAATAADAKGRATSPTAGSTEWNQWLSWTNEELHAFAEAHDWPELTNHNYSLNVAASGSSLALPTNFKKLAGALVVNGDFHNEVDPDQFKTYVQGSKVFHTGFDGGWYVNWKTPVTSATSVIIPITVYPTSLATTTHTVNLRNPMYLVKRLKVRIFKYRQDPIFTEMEAEANLMLNQMIENEYYKHAQYKGGAVTREEEAGFTLGID
jgi:hypothetical protein